MKLMLVTILATACLVSLSSAACTAQTCIGPVTAKFSSRNCEGSPTFSQVVASNSDENECLQGEIAGTGYRWRCETGGEGLIFENFGTADCSTSLTSSLHYQVGQCINNYRENESPDAEQSFYYACNVNASFSATMHGNPNSALPSLNDTSSLCPSAQACSADYSIDYYTGDDCNNISYSKEYPSLALGVCGYDSNYGDNIRLSCSAAGLVTELFQSSTGCDVTPYYTQVRPRDQCERQYSGGSAILRCNAPSPTPTPSPVSEASSLLLSISMLASFTCSLILLF